MVYFFRKKWITKKTAKNGKINNKKKYYCYTSNLYILLINLLLIKKMDKKWIKKKRNRIFSNIFFCYFSNITKI